MNIISKKVFRILAGFGFRIKMFDSDGNAVIRPEKAEWFYSSDPNFLVRVTKNEIIFNKPKSDIPKKLILMLRELANTYMYNLSVRVFGSEISPDMFSAETETVNESRDYTPLYGRLKTSYQQFGKNVRLVIRHSSPVKNKSRHCHIKSIHIIHGVKEIPVPVLNLKGAQALAYYLSKGGEVGDPIFISILYLSKTQLELKQVLSFLNSTDNLSEHMADVILMIKIFIYKVNKLFKDLLLKKTKYKEVLSKIFKMYKEVIEADSKHYALLKKRFKFYGVDVISDNSLKALSSLLSKKNKYLDSLYDKIKNSALKSNKDISESENILDVLRDIKQMNPRNKELSIFINYITLFPHKANELKSKEKIILDKILEKACENHLIKYN